MATCQPSLFLEVFYSNSLKTYIFLKETVEDHIILISTPTPNFICNFLEMIFGTSPPERRTSRDVSEVNIELLSALLYWQKGVDGADSSSLQLPYICADT